MSEFSALLEKMRENSESAPSKDENASMINEVEVERYDKK